MGNVLQEVTEPEITREHIERRVDDWVKRIDSLYSMVEASLPAGWVAERRRTIPMEAELMRRFQVPARRLPILDLIHNGRRTASIEPRGLWIVGANGRLDFTRENHRYLITDEAENFAEPAWRISPFSDRRQLEPFDRDKLQSLL